LRQHTRHREYYARFASSDGRRVVYHCGADLWLFDPAGDRSERIDTVLPSSRPQRSRRFVAPGKLIETVALHPQGHSLAITARGGAYTMPLWEGAPRRHGPVSIARQRLAAWLADGERVATVSDAGGEEEIVIRAVGGKGGKDRTISGDHGRIRTLHPSPSGPDRIAATNHRHELILIDVDRRAETVVHRSPYTWIAGVDWSPDGRWLAFAAATTRTTMSLFLYDADGGDLTAIGRSDFTDFRPSFDPEGRYLAFLSARAFDPIPDGLFHDYGFPRAVLPMLVTLQAATPSAFAVAAREPRPPGPPAPKDPAKAGETEKVSGIDLEEIAARVEAFPVPAAAYVQLEMARGRAYLLSMPLVPPPRGVNPDPPGGRLESWDFATDKLEPVAEGVTGFTISADGKVLAIRANGRLRVIPVGSKEEKENDKPGRDTGLVDLDRIRIEVNPGAEWQQMFREAWRLQRDHYWYEDLGGVDWEEVHDRYQPLVERVASRAEFSDLMWEMQGELGTSHAYELGGDYRPPPVWTQGQLGADLRFERGAWRVDRIPVGDEWNPGASSPLVGPGLDVREGDRIVAVDGREVSATISPQSLLVERASRPVTLTVKRGRDPARDVVVTPLTDEFPLRYRDWVESNREWVSELSQGKAGYIHIPDMGAPGFAEFHRYWKASVDSPGLVIDVRFNSGGNVSQLLMEKLIRRRIGYRITRWRQPYAFPTDAPAGPMVCVTNEDSGSDGDIFSHTFKMLGLGPLIGTRTWGGVVGIWPQQSLVDGTVTTQPEFATWFTDVGYGVENYGTEPDIEVVIRPQDYGAGFDPQLERGVEELLKLIEEAPPLVPELGDRPLVRFPRASKNRRRSR
jgi:tricorn protease